MKTFDKIFDKVLIVCLYILALMGIGLIIFILLNQVIHLLNRADRKGEGYDKIIEYMRDVHVWIKNIEGVRKVD
mgnify:CR=1 FL=1